MRDIKFRAWDGKSVRYDVTGFEHGLGNEMRGVFLDGDYFQMVEEIGDCDTPQAIVMQYTGVKDCDGVEIYEGDIVSDHLGTGVVRYSDKHAGFRVVYGDGLAKWFYDYNLRGERESIRVIGNVYEQEDEV